MKPYRPDYTRIVKAARNLKTDYMPLYEHAFSPLVLDRLTGRPVSELMQGDAGDRREGFAVACGYTASIGYDVFPFEGCVTELVQGGRGLCGTAPPLFSSLEDIRNWPWEELPDLYFRRFDPSFAALAEALPEGMKAAAGVGNGLFEIVQDFVPMTDLAFLEVDEPEAFALLWQKAGDLLFAVWERFLEKWGENYCLFRFGDDLGFKSSLLLKPETIRTHILPQYKRVIDLVHSHGAPFLLHSCGSIFEVMEELIGYCGIDAKHSNEDAIAPFSEWVERYGSRIGNFGGVDMDVLCSRSPEEIRDYVRRVVGPLSGLPGIAAGSGNQIADYVPPEGFLAMVETVREIRGA